MRVLIIGGGLGGLCLAQGLVKAGVEVTVFERDRTRAERLDRYRLHVSPAGSRALRACLPDSAWQAFLLGAGEAEGGFGFLTDGAGPCGAQARAETVGRDASVI